MEARSIGQATPQLLYPHEYIVEEDQMGDSGAQETLIDYLKSVLRYQFRDEGWMITGNRNFYHSAIANSEKLIVPDIAVFKDIYVDPDDQPYITSWDMRTGDKPCPPVVIEVSSASTYPGDIFPQNKPTLYGLIGVKEYFAYDPNKKQVWPKRIGTRLLGWQYNAQGQAVPMIPDGQGRLWSDVLESWLVPNGLYLRMYDRAGNLRLKAEDATAKQVTQLEQRLAALEKLIEQINQQKDK